MSRREAASVVRGVYLDIEISDQQIRNRVRAIARTRGTERAQALTERLRERIKAAA